VLEKGYLGSGNVGRNTTITRANNILPGNQPFYEHSLKLCEGLEQTFNINATVSQRSVLNMYHNDATRDAAGRRGDDRIGPGTAARPPDRATGRPRLPMLDFDNARFPIMGGLLQARGGTVRHDAVAWGFGRGADQLGVDIIQHCEVTGIKTEGGKAVGVLTSQGPISCDRLGLAAAGHSSQLAAMADLTLPIETHVLQAFVSEGIKPFLDGVVTFGAAHFYISKSDKGGLVFGGDIDGYNSYAQRGNLRTVEDVIESGVAMMPGLSRIKVLRSWGGVMDMSMDGSPIIDRTPVEYLFLNCGWCYGGFKATPASGWCFAHLLATGKSHPLAADFKLDRFASGDLIDENGRGAQANLH